MKQPRRPPHRAGPGLAKCPASARYVLGTDGREFTLLEFGAAGVRCVAKCTTLGAAEAAERLFAG